ncbi:Hsp33 family molecular chaperone HslO [Oleiagrimonas sp. MCCC 1A03011]|uniref:Hsp33 family molecular chaperone HslO n=1 Tax=Oleiagrimonas sp. MCCC 1A03011 TaxID=1926883 RepID=UPI000DC33813|nr:Hsp33 family molecular chaperone HslO [Oleiagrimonas sp. MCCC 1A03011]RAP58452.1 Hsp33 family molecular chaperone [Oleiagrimonas sp. MCCC 1A03011]
MTEERDVLHRFLLERAGVRGVLVRLNESWSEVAGRADYPQAVRRLLGESLTASALLTGQIKFDGALSLELKSRGDLRLLFAECTDAGRLRGLARHDEAAADHEAIDLSALPGATLAITIGNVETGHRYQGLVPLESAGLGAALEDYFMRSEQLPAHLVLAVGEHGAAGLLLQRMPAEGGTGVQGDADGWDRVQHLTATLSEKELLELPAQTLLYRLYHEENVRVFEPRPLAFGCSCSAQRVEAMLRALGTEEAEAALQANDGEVEVTCEFCAAQYRYDRVDIERVFSEMPDAPASTRSH